MFTAEVYTINSESHKRVLLIMIWLLFSGKTQEWILIIITGFKLHDCHLLLKKNGGHSSLWLVFINNVRHGYTFPDLHPVATASVQIQPFMGRTF